MTARSLQQALVVLTVIFLSSLPAARAEDRGRKILAEVRSALEGQQVRMHGELQARNRHGNIERSVRVTLVFQAHDDALRADYRIADALGSPLERLLIKRFNDGSVQREYTRGDPLEPAPEPDPGQAVAGMDITWDDLSMDFLWWPEVRLEGSGRVRGRPCHLLDLRPGKATQSAYSRVRLWVDQQEPAFLRAVGYDHQRRPWHRLDVHEFRRVEGRWTFSGLQLRHLPSRRETVLRIREIQQFDEVGGSTVEPFTDNITPEKVAVP